MKPAASGPYQPPSPPRQAALRLLHWQARTQAFYEALGDAGPLTMVRIPAGSFQMGSAQQEPGRHANEGPLHQVTLAEFLIGQTPITQAQWRTVARWQQRPGERWGAELNPEPSQFQGEQARLLKGETNTDRRPVERVSWQDALEFCNRLSQRTRRDYTLPSEAQWEYACRAGTSTAFHFGPILLSDLANFNGTRTAEQDSPPNPDPQPLWRQQTTPVKMFPANAWGLHDMHGNVWEWCLDSIRSSYEDGPYDGSAWLDAQATGESRKIVRGGSWATEAKYCRSGWRGITSQGISDVKYENSGFRLVCLPPGSSLVRVESLPTRFENKIEKASAIPDDAQTNSNSVFFSYSTLDEKWFNKLQAKLRPMLRGGITVWSDKRVKTRALWEDEIKASLQNARVAILLVSPNFLASDFIRNSELPFLLKVAEERNLKILWIPIEPGVYEETEIFRYQAVYSPARPLASLAPKALNAAIDDICSSIVQAINNND